MTNPSSAVSSRRNVVRLSLGSLLIAAAVATSCWLLLPRRRDVQETLSLAHQALTQGDFNTAYEQLQGIAKDAPSSAKVPEMLAELSIRQSRLEDAEYWIGQLPLESGDRTRLQMSAGFKAMELGDVLRAETILQSVLRADPNQSSVPRILAQLYQLTSREAEVRHQIALLDRSPDALLSGPSLCQYCIGARIYGIQDEPLDWLRRALRISPHSNIVRAALARLLIESTQHEEGRALLSGAVPDTPEYWRICVVQVQDSFETGNLAEAERIMKTLGAAADRDVRVWIARGRIANAKNDFKSAKAAYETAMKVDPLGTEQVGRLARLMRRSGDSKRAAELFQRAELLAALSRVTTYALMNPQDRKSALIEAGALSHRLQFKRLALLFYTALLSEFPDLSAAREKVAELRQDPSALQPLSMQFANEPTFNSR